MKREEQKNINRNTILSAAYSIMLKKGITNTSIKEISDKSKISPVTMYKYFDDKESLAEQVALQFYKKNMSEMVEVAQNKNILFKEKIRLFEKKHEEMHDILSPVAFNDFLLMTKKSELVKNYCDQIQKQIVLLMIDSGRKSGAITTSANDTTIFIFANIFMDYLSQKDEPLPNELLNDLELLFRFGVQGQCQDKKKTHTHF